MMHLHYWTTPNGYKITIFLEEAELPYKDREFMAGAYSIADMASYPWIAPHERQGQTLEAFPNLKRRFRARPAGQRAYALAKEINTQPAVTDASRNILFGQTAAAVAR